jgi:hypothetical protein
VICPSGKSSEVSVEQMLHLRHCEEHRDEAIQNHFVERLDCFASLAMTMLAAARKAQRHLDAAMVCSRASPITCAMKAVVEKIFENASSRMLKPPV